MSKRSPQIAISKVGTPVAAARGKALAQAKPMRVLIIGPSLVVPGGQAVQAARLVSNFKQEPSLRVSFLPINPQLPGPLGKLQSIKYVRTMVTSLLYVGMLLIRIRSCDIVHVFSASYWSFLLAPTPAILIARLYGKKVLLNYRSGEAEDHLRNWRSALAIIRLVDKVVVPSGYLENVFGQFGVRAEVVPNTLDLSRFAFRERQPLHPVLISNRNFEPLYNVECVLRAFAHVQREFPAARLIVVGDGSQRDKLLELRSELKLNHVEFVGQVDPESMPAQYARADIFVNSSNIDNMPASLIEAFACGLPVVTTNAGGIPYILTHNRTGLMVPRGDHKALAESVIRLLDDNVLAMRLVRAARADCQKYTWAAVRRGWLSLYEELLRAQRA
jgi:glycosyltransferase involved in cell wall biosynthesis